ncbi:TetR/AcrR family transcriptional regulator [Gordonia sp. NPDC003376]
MASGTPPARTTATSPRRYDSSLRRQQAAETRRRILDAATALFTDRGWSVGVREIARVAGVSFETVYANFGSKTALLNRVVDVAVVGDDEPVALVDRPEYAAISSGNRRRRAGAAASLIADVNRRTAGLQGVLREAAAAEPELAARLESLRMSRRQAVHEACVAIAGRPLRDDEGDGVWSVVSVEVYDLLVGSASWSADRYEKWIVETILRLLSPAGSTSNQ